MDRTLPPQLMHRIEELIDTSYSGRDKLHAASELLDDDTRSHVTEQLANHLANHAAELQQLLSANGGEKLKPTDMYSISKQYLTIAKRREGEKGVLSVAEECEQKVKERFTCVLEESFPRDTMAMLQRQRNEIKFGEHVLQSMLSTPPSACSKTST